MELAQYVREFKSATDNQDHFAMMEAAQKFFTMIHSAEYDDGKLLGIYSMAQQMETVGMDTKSIKLAVRSRVESQYAYRSILWQGTVIALNSLLIADGQPTIPLTR